MKFEDHIYRWPHIKIFQETGFEKYCNEKIFFPLPHFWQPFYEYKNYG